MPAFSVFNTSANGSKATTSTRHVLLEYQGRIETGDSHSKKEDCEFGIIDYERNTLQIGNQLLQGKRVKLNNPMAIIRPSEGESSKHGAFEIADLIWEKILFDQRPQTVVHRQ